MLLVDAWLLEWHSLFFMRAQHRQVEVLDVPGRGLLVGCRMV
jgi:hypothetical protein